MSMAPDTDDEAAWAALEKGESLRPAPTFDSPPPTEKALNFLVSLLNEREHDLDLKAEDLAKLGISAKQCSLFIDHLIPKPRKQQSSGVVVEFPVPPGRYALVLSEDEDDIGFFQVNYQKNGLLKGRQFLDRLHGAPGDFAKRPVQNKEFARIILQMIEIDPQAAAIRFGHKVGCCGICGAPLTDPISRAEGIGPICAGKYW